MSTRLAQNQKRGRSAQNNARIHTHRGRFFFTPTTTCAIPPHGVKIFLVSSDSAHTTASEVLPLFGDGKIDDYVVEEFESLAKVIELDAFVVAMHP